MNSSRGHWKAHVFRFGDVVPRGQGIDVFVEMAALVDRSTRWANGSTAFIRQVPIRLAQEPGYEPRHRVRQKHVSASHGRASDRVLDEGGLHVDMAIAPQFVDEFCPRSCEITARGDAKRARTLGQREP